MTRRSDGEVDLLPNHACGVCGAVPDWEECRPITHAYVRGWNEAITAAVQECEGERAACERHHKAQPRRLNHKVGMQIATVCAHRVKGLRPKPGGS